MVTGQKLKPDKQNSWHQYQTPNILKFANQTAVLAKRRPMPDTPTQERTEPSPLLDPSQCSRLSESKNKDAQERTPKATQRRTPSAKPTTPKVDLEPVKIALRLKYALLRPTLAVTREIRNSELLTLDSTVQ